MCSGGCIAKIISTALVTILYGILIRFSGAVAVALAIALATALAPAEQALQALTESLHTFAHRFRHTLCAATGRLHGARSALTDGLHNTLGTVANRCCKVFAAALDLLLAKSLLARRVTARAPADLAQSMANHR
jgi:hypothetical protein